MVTQTFTFLLAGGASTGIYFGLLAFTYEWLGWDRFFALSFAYVTAVSFHFLMNRRITFTAQKKNLWPQIAKYVAMAIFNYLMTLSIVWLLQSQFLLNLYLATSFAIVATMVSGFLLMKRWVFK